MGFYAYSNDVAFDVFIPNYGIANAFGLYYGDRGDGLTDFLGNEIVPREYNCFFFTSNRIIGIKQDNHKEKNMKLVLFLILLSFCLLQVLLYYFFPLVFLMHPDLQY